MDSEKWRYVHASVAGLAHLNQETECQDKLVCGTIETKEGEILIAAVADGAGSTAHGQIGAEIACETFINEIKAFLQTPAASVKSVNEDFGKHWLEYFQKKIEAIAKENKIAIRDYASTFIGAVVGMEAAAFFQIGDGAAVYSVSGAPGSYRFCLTMQEAEYLNITNFLTDETAGEELRYTLIKEKIEDLILFSDGIYAVAVDYQTNQPFERFLMPMIAPLRNKNSIDGLNEKLEKFLSSSKINEKTDDDKTIILASRHKSGTRG
jgi:serine/threonine protein phosphatase PrpC